MDYVELHLHDHYSALDGLNTPAEYMERAKELGMTHLAQTNHGTLAGHRDFQRSAKEAGIVPILGVEAYISSTDRFDRRTTSKRDDGTQAFNHIGLLAMNENGLRNLNLLMSEAWQSGFYYKPRIDIELLEEFNEDIIILSGCMNGLMSKSLEANDYDRALRTARKMREIAGERFFMEIQGHNPAELNAGLLRLAEDVGALPVVTSDCHYARKEDLWVEEAMLIISTNPKMDKSVDLSKAQKMDMLDRFNYLYPDRKMTFQEIEIYLRSAEEQAVLLNAQGVTEQAISNTMVVANMIGDYPYYEGLDLLPSPDVSIKDYDAALREMAFKGLEERGLGGSQEHIDRLDHELDVIKHMKFAIYFLILADAIQWAVGKGIFVGPGRGSGISSLVNYSLRITNIDPLPYKLLFFRFLDPDRPDWPDVDVDIEIGRRHEVKEYIIQKYGHVANIMTFTYLRGKSSLKRAAQVFKIPVGEVNAAMSTLGEGSEDILQAYENFEPREYLDGLTPFKRKYPEVLELAKRLEGRISGFGMHAGGIVLSKSPIEDYVPMQTATDPQDESKDRVPVIGVDMNDAAAIGMIKYDLLGLNNLTVILEAIAHIKQRHGIEIDPYELPLDDPKVYELLSKGYTKGVFQCEGGPYTKLLMKMGGVDNFEDLVSSNALVRPGAGKSSIGAAYIKGKMTGEFEYIHASTKYFTSETYGQILFQEQQMLLCTEVAGMSMRDANQVRQAISKKKADKLAIWKPAFIEGATQTLGERKANAVWTDLEKSAEYAFNRAHSVGYSLISYWTAWFKVNYPLEYMTALLNNVSGGDEKDKTLDYLMEAKRLGIKILLPHVNMSGIKNTIQGDGMRMGLSSVKYISGKVGSKIVEHRPYKSYGDLLNIAGQKGSGINSRAVSALNLIGAAAFDDNPKTGNERDSFYEYLNIPAFDSATVEPHIVSQLTGLDEFTEDDTFVCSAMVRGIRVGTGWALVDLVDETGSVSVFTSQDTPIEKGKMYVFLIAENRIARYVTTDELARGEGGTFAKWLNRKELNMDDDQMVCISWKTRNTKSGWKMANAVFSDREKNLVSAVAFGKTIDTVMMPCVAAQKVRPVFGEGKSGGLVLEGFERD